MLRDPVNRYVSEWLSLLHEDRYLKNEPRLFRNESLELQKKKLACYVGKRLDQLPLQDFLDCSENGAGNRQTRMMANMTFVRSLGLSGSALKEAMLASAKNTIQTIPFFGLFSRPSDTQKLLESTIGINFRKPLSFEDRTISEVMPFSGLLKDRILQANDLDLKLYQFAKDLFRKRVSVLKFPQSSKQNSGHSSDDFKMSSRPDIGLNVDGEALVNEIFNENKFIDAHSNYVYDNHHDEDRSGDNTNLETLTSSLKLDDFKVPGLRNKVQENMDDFEMKQSPFSGFDKVDLSANSPDYRPDVEDVDVFLNRLEKLKRQKRDVSLQFQQKLRTNSDGAGSLSQSNNEMKSSNQVPKNNADNRRDSNPSSVPAIFRQWMKPPDLNTKGLPYFSKRGKTSYQKAVDRMFL